MDEETYKILSNAERNHWWYLGRRALLGYFIEKLVDKKKQNLILDAGCSTGANLSFFKQYGWVCGLDFYREALRLCPSYDSARVIQADANNLPFLPESYDLIVALDLLEHLRDDTKPLSEFNYVLKQNGYLIITVPAYKFLWSDFDILSSHFKRYALKELKQGIEKAGFEIKKITYFNCLLFPAFLIDRLTKKIFKYPVYLKSELALPVKGVNDLFKKIILSEIELLKKFNLPFGGSILCIAKKRI